LSDEISDLDEMLGFLAEEGRNLRDPQEHPSPETLTAYQAKELSPEEDERIQSHLGVCRHCTEMLLELEEEFLPPVEVGVAPAADFEAAADWRKLRSRMKGPKRRLTYAVAAVLLLTVVGLSIYALSRGPERFKTLEPLGSYRSPAGEIEVVELPVTLVLRSSVRSHYPEYRAELLDEHNHRIREFPHLQESRPFEVEVPLGRRDLNPGEYRVRLLGVTDRGADPVGEYVFKVKS
jgi:hypothetical protein